MIFLQAFSIWIFVAFCSAGLADAATFNRTAKSGKPTRMGDYKSWDDNCKSNGGSVTVVRKPEHGRLISGRIMSKIMKGRTKGYTQCTGTPIMAFEVKYQSDRGYRGVDTFAVKLVGSNVSDVDEYTVNVE